MAAEVKPRLETFRECFMTGRLMIYPGGRILKHESIRAGGTLGLQGGGPKKKKKNLERLRRAKSIHTNPLTQSDGAAIYLFFTALKVPDFVTFQPRSVADEVRPHSHSSPLSKVHHPVLRLLLLLPRRGSRPILPHFLPPLLRPLWLPVSSRRPRAPERVT